LTFFFTVFSFGKYHPGEADGKIKGRQYLDALKPKGVLFIACLATSATPTKGRQGKNALNLPLLLPALTGLDAATIEPLMPLLTYLEGLSI